MARDRHANSRERRDFPRDLVRVGVCAGERDRLARQYPRRPVRHGAERTVSGIRSETYGDGCHRGDDRCHNNRHSASRRGSSGGDRQTARTSPGARTQDIRTSFRSDGTGHASDDQRSEQGPGSAAARAERLSWRAGVELRSRRRAGVAERQGGRADAGRPPRSACRIACAGRPSRRLCPVVNECSHHRRSTNLGARTAGAVGRSVTGPRGSRYGAAVIHIVRAVTLLVS